MFLSDKCTAGLIVGFGFYAAFLLYVWIMLIIDYIQLHKKYDAQNVDMLQKLRTDYNFTEAEIKSTLDEFEKIEKNGVDDHTHDLDLQN